MKVFKMLELQLFLLQHLLSVFHQLMIQMKIKLNPKMIKKIQKMMMKKLKKMMRKILKKADKKLMIKSPKIVKNHLKIMENNKTHQMMKSLKNNPHEKKMQKKRGLQRKYFLARVKK